MHEHLDRDAELVTRFEREAQVAARLNHANVVPVVDVGDHGGRPVMVLEYAPGPTLTMMMFEGLSRERIVDFVKQICNGLDHAHATGLVHRDLKPDNVIVENGTTPRIVDFGIAFLRDPDATDDGGRLTASGVMMGTPAYMAPEQARGGDIDHRVDLFALGVIVYEMLAGRTPFTGTAMEVAIQNMDSDPPRIAGADPLLEALARHLMARDPDARPATAHAAAELAALIERDPDAAATALGVIDVARALATIGLPR